MKIFVTFLALLFTISTQAAESLPRNSIKQSIINKYVPKELQTSCILRTLSDDIDFISRVNRRLYQDNFGQTFISNITVRQISLENTAIKEGILYAVKIENKFSSGGKNEYTDLTLSDPVPLIGTDTTNGRAGTDSYFVLETRTDCKPQIVINKK